ncbi:MAG: hypothetical protein HOH16_00965 [Planctomycetaceae bacterium]|nr:hypothetical protein [Planctomycetaceae bacterium]
MFSGTGFSFQPLVFFDGSCILPEAIQIHRLDRRLAFAALSLQLVGECPIRITLAVALVSGVMSAFILNTATSAMMVAIVAGILSAIEEAEEKAHCSPNRQF